jgi:hypothetical protein
MKELKEVLIKNLIDNMRVLAGKDKVELLRLILEYEKENK